jgi:hypothetical protein
MENSPAVKRLYYFHKKILYHFENFYPENKYDNLSNEKKFYIDNIFKFERYISYINDIFFEKNDFKEKIQNISFLYQSTCIFYENFINKYIILKSYHYNNFMIYCRKYLRIIHKIIFLFYNCSSFVKDYIDIDASKDSYITFFGNFDENTIEDFSSKNIKNFAEINFIDDDLDIDDEDSIINFYDDEAFEKHGNN